MVIDKIPIVERVVKRGTYAFIDSVQYLKFNVPNN